MNDSYKEILIKRNTPVGNKILKGLLIALAAISIFIGLVFWPLLIVGAVLVVVCWLFVPKLEVEYEYLYVNGELDIDAIYSKQKRKKMGSYDASELEILAPGEVCVTVHEGKFHQVKRMLAACGAPVTYLRRLSMGPLRLDETLTPGQFRLLSQEEIANLRFVMGK